MNGHSETQLRPEDFALALQELGTYTDVSVDDLMQLHQAAERHARLRNSERLRVDRLMTHPVTTVNADCPLSDAAHILVSRRISGLPVVDDRHRLRGIITEADFLRALGVPSHHPAQSIWQTLENLFDQPVPGRRGRGIVEDLMMKEVITVAPDQTLHQAIDAMKRNRIKRLVVCDEMRRVLGMITRSDLVRLFFDRFKSNNNQRPKG